MGGGLTNALLLLIFSEKCPEGEGMVECTDPRLMGTWGTRTKYWLLVLNCVNLQNYEVLTASDFFRHNENLSRAIEEKQTPTLYLWERRLFFVDFCAKKTCPHMALLFSDFLSWFWSFQNFKLYLLTWISENLKLCYIFLW